MNEKIERILKKVQKPSWYTGNEFNAVVKDKNSVSIRYAFCFPDLYDIGMSHLGIKILYSLLNTRPDTWCERVFTPNDDMVALMKEYGQPLFALESKDEIRNFDIIGITLQYEMCYTNILTMLDLAGIPFFAKDRGDDMPLIMGGGPCCSNPEPIADFFDVITVGEGEENIMQMMDLYLQCGKNKRKFLEKVRDIEGIYVPALDNGRKVTRSIIKDLDSCYYPDKFVVPYAEVVHDRIMLEIMRGCVRGCRFCQAGMIYRPFRQKSPGTLLRQAKALCGSTGYDEISLTSLSTSDYQYLSELTNDLLVYCTPQHVDLALPSLRVDNFTKELLEKVQAVRKSGLTFAPEAGTQRLRNVINKNVTDEDIERTCRIAFEGGTNSVKLYFMIGLPTETDEDIIGISETASRIMDYFYKYSSNKKRGVFITISLSTFVPKPWTPFQWESQISLEEIDRRQQLLKSHIRSRRIVLNYHDGTTSAMEGVFSRGDRKLSKLLVTAWNKGCHLDAWSEHFDFDKWTEAMAETGITFEDYARRKRDFSEVLPWDFIDMGVTRKYLQHECEKAYRAETSANCLEKCTGCGVNHVCSGDLCPKKAEDAQ